MLFRSAGLPAWLKAIPESNSHGSGTLQKRLWKITSDYVRITDWYQFKGKCVATGQHIESWQASNAGHFLSYVGCYNMFKFDRRNIHMQQAKSNLLGDHMDGKKFGDTLEIRYGKDICAILEAENRRHKDIMINGEVIIDEIKKLLEDFQHTEERPEYVKRSYKLLNK